MDLWSKFDIVKKFMGSFSGSFLPVLIILLLFILTWAVPTLLKRSKGGATGRRKAVLEDVAGEFREAVGIVEEELGSAGALEAHLVSSGTNRDDGLNETVKAAESDPGLGVIQLSAALEKEVGLLAASTARRYGKRLSNLRGPLKPMLEKKHLPDTVSRAMELFSRLSDPIVRGKIAGNSPIVRQTLADGLALLNTIKRTHSVIHKVERTGVDVFSDEECRNVLRGRQRCDHKKGEFGKRAHE